MTSGLPTWFSQLDLLSRFPDLGSVGLVALKAIEISFAGFLMCTR